MLETDAEPFEVLVRGGCVLRGLRYQVAEDDPGPVTALCLHGASADAHSFHWVAEALARAGVPALVPDQRGHGLSDGSRVRDLGPDGLAADAALLCAELGLERVILVTQSYAGRIGLELLRSAPDGLVIDGLFAQAPSWVARSHPLRELPLRLLRTSRLLWRIGRHVGCAAHREPMRKDYPAYAGQPDIHPPRMIEEARSVSWFVYAALFLEAQGGRYRRPPDWSSLAHLPVWMFASRHDRLWGNEDLVVIARLAGWPLSWIECGHLGVATEQRHAETFVRGVLGALSGNAGSSLDS